MLCVELWDRTTLGNDMSFLSLSLFAVFEIKGKKGHVMPLQGTWVNYIDYSILQCVAIIINKSTALIINQQH